MFHTGSNNAVPFLDPNTRPLLNEYQKLDAAKDLISQKFDEIEELPGYAFYCDKCDHIDMKRSDFIRHKIVHITPSINDFISFWPKCSEEDDKIDQQVPRDSKNPCQNTSNLKAEETKSENIKALDQAVIKKTTSLLNDSPKTESRIASPTKNSFPAEKKYNKKSELKDGEGFMKHFKISSDLAAIIGDHPEGISRQNCVKELWNYLKSNNLQDPQNKQFFIPDQKMAKIFRFERLRSISMSKYIIPHLLPLDGSVDKVINPKQNAISEDMPAVTLLDTKVPQSMHATVSNKFKKKLDGTSEVNELVTADAILDKNEEIKEHDNTEDQKVPITDIQNEIEMGFNENCEANTLDESRESDHEWSEMDCLMQLPLF